MIPKEIFPTTTEVRKNREYWNPRCLTYLGERMYFEEIIRTGECFFCKKHGWIKRSPKTYLHHVTYDDKNPLFWTIEVCSKCHFRIDPANRRVVERHSEEKSWALIQKHMQNSPYSRYFHG